MGCIVKTPANRFNFMIARSVSSVLITDLGDVLDECAAYVEAPLNLSATTDQDGVINVSWNMSGVVGETSLTLQRSLSAGSGFSDLATLAPDTATYPDSSVDTYTNYYYRVRANGGSANSAWSNVGQGLAILNEPITLTIDNQTLDSLRLNWSDESGSENGYSIERSTEPDSGFSQINTVSANIETYTDTGIIWETTYYYRVRAIGDNSGYSGYSNIASGTTLVLFAPSDIVFSSITYTGADIDWTSNSGGDEDNFSLERSDNGVSGWSVISTNASGDTDYTDTGRVWEEDYFYRVRAIKDGKYTPYSAINSYTTLTLNPPSDIVLTPSVGQILIEFTSNSGGNEDNFSIEHSTTGVGSWSEISLNTSGDTDYTHTSLLAETTHYYRVRAVKSSKYTAYSAIASDVVPRIAAPTLLTATGGIGQIDLSFTDNSSEETGFEIEVSDTGSGGWSSLNTNAANDTTYSHTSLLAEVTRFYRVKATHPSGDSTYSNIDSATTVRIQAPTIAVSVPSKPSQLQIDITSNSSGQETGIDLYRSLTGTGSWAIIKQLPRNVLTHTDKNTVPSQDFYYKAVAKHPSGDSVDSNIDNDQIDYVASMLGPVNLGDTQLGQFNTP